MSDFSVTTVGTEDPVVHPVSTVTVTPHGRVVSGYSPGRTVPVKVVHVAAKIQEG